MDQNPYAAPSADLLGQTNESEAINTRNANLKHEASVKSVGLFYYLTGFFTFLGGAIFLFSIIAAPGEFAGLQGLVGFLSIVYLLVGALALYGGRQLRNLSERAKVPTAIVSGLGLLAFPVGTLINGYILYLVFSKKGTLVLSEEYRQVIEKTPHIQYKTPIYIWVLLALILIGLVLAIVFAA